jgi:probable rRNA maturation factor
MSALFRNSQKALNVLPGDVTVLAEFVLTEEGASDREVSILFVSNREISDLNAKYLSREGPTDVLAFPMDAREEEEGAGERPSLRGGESDGPRNHAGAWLGDVVVSAERALEYAGEHRLDPAEELSLYLVHGLLHLLGYDDADPRDRRKMRRRERELMQGARRRGILLRVETPETRAH